MVFSMAVTITRADLSARYPLYLGVRLLTRTGGIRRLALRRRLSRTCGDRRAIAVPESCKDIVARCCDARNISANDTATARSITRRDCAKAVRSEGR